MKYLVMAFLAVMILVKTNCQASCCHLDNNKTSIKPYAGVIGGVSFINIESKKGINNFDFNPGYYISGNLGCKFFNQLKLEGEVSYQKSSLHSIKLFSRNYHTKGNIHSWSYLTNILYEFNFLPLVKPYLGVGTGYNYNKGKWQAEKKKSDYTFFLPQTSSHVAFKKESFAWQPIVGMKFLICYGLEMSLDYRCLIMEKIQTHKLGLNLIYSF